MTPRCHCEFQVVRWITTGPDAIFLPVLSFLSAWSSVAFRNPTYVKKIIKLCSSTFLSFTKLLRLLQFSSGPNSWFLEHFATIFPPFTIGCVNVICACNESCYFWRCLFRPLSAWGTLHSHSIPTLTAHWTDYLLTNALLSHYMKRTITSFAPSKTVCFTHYKTHPNYESPLVLSFQAVVTKSIIEPLLKTPILKLKRNHSN